MIHKTDVTLINKTSVLISNDIQSGSTQKDPNSLRKAHLTCLFTFSIDHISSSSSNYGENRYNGAYILTSTVIEHIFDILMVSGFQWWAHLHPYLICVIPLVT